MKENGEVRLRLSGFRLRQGYGGHDAGSALRYEGRDDESGGRFEREATRSMRLRVATTRGREINWAATSPTQTPYSLSDP